jgi:hypothetical protein|eukprot:COSAG01_NODE_13_length_41723_cov_145.394556_44_plen_64_part_00
MLRSRYPTLLLVRDTAGAVRGGLASRPWARAPTPGAGSGSGEAFVVRALGKIDYRDRVVAAPH